MGMAASQGSALFITARLSAIEFESQQIMSSILNLATQKDAIYQDYCDALDKKNFNVAFNNNFTGGKQFVDANYSTLCEYNENRPMQYALRNNDTGKLIVSEEVKEIYDLYNNDKYAFAFTMLGIEIPEGENIGIGNADASNGGGSLYMTPAEAVVFNTYKSSDSKLVSLYENIENTEGKNKTAALEEFRDYLYSKYGSQIFNSVKFKQEGLQVGNLNALTLSGSKSNKEFVLSTDETWDDIKAEFNYYVNLFEAISNCGGCQAVDSENAMGENANDWLVNMVKSGLVTILAWDDIGARNSWSDISVATNYTSPNYIQEVGANDAELKKAENDYEYKLGLINDKEKKLQNELSKLALEEETYKNMLKSVNNIRDENIKRTLDFGS